MINRIIIIAAVLGLISTAIPALGAEGELKMTDSGITIFYPAGMEAQAKKVVEIAKKSILPSIEVHRQTLMLLKQPDVIAEQIASLLNADEKKDDVQTRLTVFRQKSEALIQCFSTIRLVKKSAAVATNGIDAGILQVRYLKDKDEFNMSMDFSDSSEDRVKRSYFPVLVNSDGSLRSGDKIGEMAIGFLGSGEPIAIAPLHETISYVMAQQLKLYHPFARWFNDGVSGWITRQLVIKSNTKLAAIAEKLFAINDQTRQLKEKVNLYAWPQPAYENRRGTLYDPAVETASTQYAVELITQLLGANGSQTLPKIMSDLNYRGNPDTNTICDAIKKATGKDAKSALLGYSPSGIRNAISSADDAKLTDDAQKLVDQKQWAEAVNRLQSALQITPTDVNARLNLAWIERLAGDRLDSEIQVFLCAALLNEQKYSFHLYAQSLEGNYVVGRLAILMGNLETAKQLIEPIVKLKPDHEDAKKALEEIQKMEAAAKAQ